MAVRSKAGKHAVEFQQGGVRVFRRCPPGTTKAQAQQWEAKLRREHFSQAALGERPVISLAAAIQEWLNHTLHDKKDQRMPKQNALQLAEFVRGKTVAEAPKAAQEAVKAWAGILGPATINRRLAVLKAASKYAWRMNWVETNVSGRIPRLREPEGRKMYLTAKQITLLADSAPHQKARAAIMIAAYSGLRASELLALGSVTTRAAFMTVRTSKNGQGRDVPVVGLIRPYLRQLPLGICYRTLCDWWWAAREKAGMPHVHFHDLRHTTASLLANKGVDLYVIGKILGHKAVQTTARYAHLTDKTAREAMRKLG